MSSEAGRWILLFSAVAWSTHMAKLIGLYILLWRNRRNCRNGPTQLIGFLFLLNVLVLLPYQDPKASKAMNRFLLVATILQYLSWVALAYIILVNR